MKSNISRSDIISVVVLFSFLVPLSLWGGYTHWGRETDLLPIYMLGAVVLYLIFQGLRLGSPRFGAAVGGMAILATFVPSLFIYTSQLKREEDLFAMLIVFLACIALGAGAAAIGKKFDTPHKLRTMDKSKKARIWGFCFLPIGIILFLIGQQVPRGFPLGLLAWILQLLGIYLSVFLGIVKLIRGK